MLALKHCAKKSELLESGGGGGFVRPLQPPCPDYGPENQLRRSKFFNPSFIDVYFIDCDPCEMLTCQCTVTVTLSKRLLYLPVVFGRHISAGLSYDVS